MKIEKVKIGSIKPNKENPRIIKDSKFKKLVQSIKDFPQMLDIRPIVVDEQMVILGGNMRFKASLDAGIDEVSIIQAKGLTEAQKQEFIIKDNVSFGEWDWDTLANTYEAQNLVDWGMELMHMGTQEHYGYVPEYTPTINTSEVTSAQVEARAKEIAKEIVKTMVLKSVVCPECMHEFEVS